MTTITQVNPADRSWTKRTYLFAFGTYGERLLLVWANGVDAGFDEAIDWVADNAPGRLCDDSVQEEYKRLVAEGKSEDEAWEEATVDTTCGGNNGHYIPSSDWTIVGEDMTTAELVAIDPTYQEPFDIDVEYGVGYAARRGELYRVEEGTASLLSRESIPEVDDNFGREWVLVRAKSAEQAILIASRYDESYLDLHDCELCVLAMS
jgi:hypothetical protein